MKEEGSIALFQYWNRLRDGRPAPKRTEIEPSSAAITTERRSRRMLTVGS